MTPSRLLLTVGLAAIALGGGAGAAPARAANRIYWSNAGGDRISYANQDGSGGGGNLNTTGASGGIGSVFFYGLAIDLPRGRLYWADYNETHPNEDAISFANLDGSGGGNLNTTGATLSAPVGVAIDPLTNRIYWANSFGSTAISYANLDGSGGGDLDTTGATVEEPSGVAIDVGNGRIYWANAHGNVLSYANLDGSGGGDIAITGPPTVNKPEGVAIDPAAGRIYWADRGSNQISWANLDGTGGEDLNTTGATVSEPIGVAVDPAAGRIYWGNFAGGVDKKTSFANLNGSGGGDLDISGATETGAFSFPALLQVPSGAGAPTVAGGSATGSTLACSQGSWAADLGSQFLFRFPQSLAYAWQLNGTDIPGADGAALVANQPGSYTCRVSATNVAGSSAQTSAPHLVSPPSPATSTTPSSAGPPPETKITAAKVNRAKATASFQFKALSGAARGFQCELRRRPGRKAHFGSCSSPKTYQHLKPGRYTFEVRAIGPGGFDLTPAKRAFTIPAQ